MTDLNAYFAQVAGQWDEVRAGDFTNTCVMPRSPRRVRDEIRARLRRWVEEEAGARA